MDSSTTENITKPPKTHGLSHGLNLQQIVSYFIITTKFLVFQFLLIQHFILPWKIVLSAVYYIANITVIAFGAITTLTDPTDEIAREELRAKENGEPFDSSKYEFNCETCNVSVSNNTKHCRVCERCVSNFDHHCEWINNCVSDKNYKSFIILISALAISAAFFAITGIIFSLNYYTSWLNVLNGIDNVKKVITGWKIYAILFYTVLNVGLFLVDMRLIIFHCYLYVNNMTTYQYIVKLREMQKAKQAQRRSSIQLMKGKMSHNIDQEQLDSPADHRNNDDDNGYQLKIVRRERYRVQAHHEGNNYGDGGYASSNGLMYDSSAPTSMEIVSERDKHRRGPSQIFVQAQNVENNEDLERGGYENGEDVVVGGGQQAPIRKTQYTFSVSPMLKQLEQEGLSPNTLDRKKYEIKHVASNIAKIGMIYGPRYGRIVEEDNESEKQNYSHSQLSIQG